MMTCLSKALKPLISGIWRQFMNGKKCYAEFITWAGKKVKYEVKREWAEDIAAAVEGQYLFADNVTGFAIRGWDFAHVDIYEVAA